MYSNQSVNQFICQVSQFWDTISQNVDTYKTYQKCKQNNIYNSLKYNYGNCLLHSKPEVDEYQ